jgi:hypothetical protein
MRRSVSTRSGRTVTDVLAWCLAGCLRVLARWAVGKHWHGQARSDATFWCDGTQGEPGWWGTGRESRWVLLAGYKRAGLRLAVAAALVGLWRWRHVTEWALALVVGPVLGLVLWGRVLAVRLWRHRRTLERPMAAALAPFLGVAPRTVEAGLAVEPDFEDAAGGEHVAAVELPDHWAATGDQKARVQEVMQARLGVELKWQWQTSRYPMLLNVTRAPVPPSLVPLAEVLAELDARPTHKVLLGRAADASLHWWNRASEDPMVAVHGGSRRGKTSLLLSLASQELARSGLVTAIDPKRVSLMALAGCPGFTLANDPRDIHGMWQNVTEFRSLIEDRYEALASDPTIEFPYALLIIDEVSMFAGLTRQAWLAEKPKSAPPLAPVWDDVATCCWLGAQCRAHVVVAGQRLDYQILGGMLGSFGTRLLAGYLPQDYVRLVGVPPVLRSQKPRGRFLLYQAGGDPTWLQLTLGSPEAWRDYVLERVRSGSDLGATAGTGTRDSGELVGLAAAAAHLGMEVEAFRKARQRRPVPGETVGPDGRSPAWPAGALTAWREDRPAASRTGSPA